MPIEKRDKQTGARLFIPTTSERTFMEKQRKLNEGLKEIEDMKKELQRMMEDMKDN